MRPASLRVGESVRDGDSEGGQFAARTRRLAESQATVQSGEADRPRSAISRTEFAAYRWIGRAGGRRSLDKLILNLHGSVSETYERQERPSSAGWWTNTRQC